MKSTVNNHEEILRAMDSCRNGNVVDIELPDKEISITTKQRDVYYTFYATRPDGSTVEVEGIAVRKLLIDYDFRI